MAVRAVVDSASLPDASTAKWRASGGVCAGSHHVCMNARRVLPCQLHDLQYLRPHNTLLCMAHDKCCAQVVHGSGGWHMGPTNGIQQHIFLVVLPGKGPGCGSCGALGSASWSAGHVSVCSCAKAAVCVTDQLKPNHHSSVGCAWYQQGLVCGLMYACKQYGTLPRRLLQHTCVRHIVTRYCTSVARQA